MDIENIEKLLEIHFVLTRKDENGEYGIIDFVNQLDDRIRRFKTTIKPRNYTYNGRVKGKINWMNTFKERFNSYPQSKYLFVCDVKEKNFNTPENLVLKELLGIIYKIVL